MMYPAEQTKNVTIDLQGIKRLLYHLSLLLDISIDVKSPDGETMLGGPESSMGTYCSIREAAEGTCSADSLHLIRQLETSGRMLQKKCDGIEIIGIPLKCNKELIGILCACRRADEGSMVKRAGPFLEEIAHRISCEIQSQFEAESLADELSHRYEELSLVYDVGKELGKLDSSEESIKFIIENLQKALEPDMAVISIPGRDVLEIQCSSPSGLPIDIHDRPLISKIDKIFVRKLSSPELHPAHLVLDGTCDSTFPVDLQTVSLEVLGAPVKLNKSAVGMLYIINFFETKKTFQTGDMRLLISLAEQVSMIITSAELYQNLKDFLLNVIKTLVYSIEAKDSYTRGHSERVSRLAMMIAEAMDLSPGEKEALNLAAVLHDIGKIGVPGKILNKVGKLTSEEFLLIKDHPDKGFRILKPIEQLNESLSAIRHHHERYDGTGYPSGLKGKEIPLYARMIAIADMYDAMTSRRSYRENISHEDAIADIITVKGKQLDPEIVEIFVKKFQSGSIL
jgi:HD-GYP domain-containing protein (c-di-GMP phosphodiesterase class II)